MHESVADLFERRRLVLIAGPCVIESADLCLQVAGRVRKAADERSIGYIFKASFDKANRTSADSFRGPGLAEGLRILARVKREVDVPVLTDIHQPDQAAAVADVVDVLQIPAFLCRQTDLVVAAAKTGLPTNIKKGQFLAPADMQHIVDKHRRAGGGLVALTERGTSFGYGDLVVDMRALDVMRRTTSAAIIFDATHAVQKPGGDGNTTGGDRQLAPPLARAATAVGIDGLFCEVHPDPDRALSDGKNSLSFELLEQTLDQVTAIDRARRQVS